MSIKTPVSSVVVQVLGVFDSIRLAVSPYGALQPRLRGRARVVLGDGQDRRATGGSDHNQPGLACGELKRKWSQGYYGRVVIKGPFSRLLEQIT